MLAARGAAAVLVYLRIRDPGDQGGPKLYRSNRASGTERVLAEINDLGGNALAIEADLADAGSLHPEALASREFYSPEPYHRVVRASQTFWRPFLRLAASLQGQEFLFCQILFAPVRHPWQRNIAGISAMEKSLGSRAPLGRTASAKNLAEPLYAASIRIGSSKSDLAAGIEALGGIFTSEGRPFHCRTEEDYARVLSFEEIVGMLRQRTTHVPGQLFTSSELGLTPSKAVSMSVRV